MAQSFVVRHKSAGKFFHPEGGKMDPKNDTCVVLFDGVRAVCEYAFDISEQPWGYIRHVPSGKYLHPKNGSLHPGNDTDLVIYEDKHAACLFALDDANDMIVHKGSGKYAHPKGGKPNPGNDTRVVLHEDKHDAMKFEFMDYNNPSKKILPYGKPLAVGEWKRINTVINPLGLHEDTVQVKIGKEVSETKTTEWTYSWESSVGVSIDIFDFGVNQSLSVMMSRSSTHTWSEETTRTTKITVQPGETVVTWQFQFAITQGTYECIFNSNLLADTNDPNVVPDDIAITYDA